MAVRFTKQKALIILVIFLTVLVGVAAIVTAVIVSGGSLTGRSKAGSNPTCNLYNGDYGPGGIAHCTDAHQICGGIEQDGQCVQVGQHCTDTPICDACESGYRLQGNSCVQESGPEETCNVGGNIVNKNGFCKQTLAEISGQNADAKNAWCGTGCCNNASVGGETAEFCKVSGDSKCGVNGNPFEPSNQCTESDKSAYCSYRSEFYCSTTGACSKTPCTGTTPTPTTGGIPLCNGSTSPCRCNNNVCQSGELRCDKAGGNVCLGADACRADNDCDYNSNGKIDGAEVGDLCLNNKCIRKFAGTCTQVSRTSCGNVAGKYAQGDDRRFWNQKINIKVVDDSSGGAAVSGVNVSLAAGGTTPAIGVRNGVSYTGDASCFTGAGWSNVQAARANGTTTGSTGGDGFVRFNDIDCFGSPYQVLLGVPSGYEEAFANPCQLNGGVGVCTDAADQGSYDVTCHVKKRTVITSTPTTVTSTPTATATPPQKAYCTPQNTCSYTQTSGRECTTNSQCQPDTHLECENNACVQKPGAGNNSCTNNGQCGEQDTPRCTGLVVQRGGTTLLNGQSVVPGETLSYTLTGQINGSTPATAGGISITTTPGGATNKTSTLTGTFQVPASGTGISIVGLVKDRFGREVTPGANECRIAFALPQPTFEIDKVAIDNTGTPINGGDRCHDPSNPKLNCPSVTVTQNDVVTYKLLMKNTGTVPITNAVAKDVLTTTASGGLGDFEFDTSNTGNAALAMRLCTNKTDSNPVVNGICTGFDGDTSRNKNLSPSVTFPAPATTQLVWGAITTINPKEIFEAEIRIKVKATATLPTNIKNTLTVTTDQVCQTGCDDSIIHTGDVSISKTASTVNANTGDTITYTLSVRNPTGSPITGIDIVDTPGYPFARYYDMSTTPASSSTNSTPGGAGTFTPSLANATSIRWNGQTIAANTTATYTYTLKLLSDINDDQPDVTDCRIAIPNSAEVRNGSTVLSNSGQFTLNVQIPPARCVKTPGLDIKKTANPTATCPNSQVNFTITVTNTGETVQLIKEIIDDLDAGFVYRTGSARITAPNNNVFNLEPALSNGNLRLTWNFTSQAGGGITLQPSENMLIGFAVNAPNATSGTFRNRVYVSNPPSSTAEATVTMTNSCTPVTGIETQIVIAALAASAMIGLGVVAHKTKIIEGLYAAIGTKIKDIRTSKTFEDRVMRNADSSQPSKPKKRK